MTLTDRRISCSFATDHYGELGLSRLNVFASNDRQQGLKIVVSNSYSANAGLTIEVATALYKAGVPLLIYDAEKLLRILCEEGTVYELPWEYECLGDGEFIVDDHDCRSTVLVEFLYVFCRNDALSVYFF